MDALFRRWGPAAKPPSAAPPSLDAHEKGEEPHKFDSSSNGSNQDDETQPQLQEDHQVTGAEWVLIDEPSGFFFPQITRQRQRLELDQVHHVLHYARYRRVMRIHDISLVTSVEEVAADGRHQWWMTVQDPHSPQVWVVHFPSWLRLQAWIELLRSVVRATGGSAIVSDVVRASTLDRHRRRSSASITIVKHLEEVGIWEPETRAGGASPTRGVGTSRSLCPEESHLS
ncbi:hypothetical protein PybrP1_011683 [[Pythium] brassicae (nom. inval.)]|nr:hypothetical protein PybrP1_011683 [[Pythium] brassicae (nom. inval.)]